MCISGIANLAQTGLDSLVYRQFHGNPVPVNILLGSLGAIAGGALTTFVAIKGRAFIREKDRLGEQPGYGATDGRG